ncbi:hypothetical protein WJX81_003067 [Elliptochloris bilobata]|uniref:EF-hand domain-containing protein n=1 Tax=Elliptochloris bilobata TaxID=381761 RepID=A0AAW1QUE1_9CHLO
MDGLGLPAWVVGGRERLRTVQEFFNYVEGEGRSFFCSLDRNGDGAVSLDDLRAAMRARKLPEEYATQFLVRARRGRWWVQRVRWPEFKRMVEEKEPAMLRAFTALEGVNAAGKMELRQIKSTLKRLGLDSSDDNARAMIQALDAREDRDGCISYGKFRNFLILLPPANLERDPSTAWFEAATIVPFGPPRRKARPGKLLVRAALAGGIASGVTTLAMFPLDTMKARVQAMAGASVGSVVRSVPSIGLRGLYRGVVPAVVGQFVSHGTRTAAFEGTLMALAALGAGAGGARHVQWQGLASGVGTVLGTVTRIPAEVLKQRLQVGLHPNAAVALRIAWRETGLPGLFRGTTSLLAREVPFYMFGMMGYAALKRQFDGSAHGHPRELARWEAVALGGLAGALASILTTPADVLKTRIMTASADRSVDAGAMLASIVREEGVGALWKGALPRACWTAPLGAMNFAGYELAKKALAQREREAAPAAMEASPG